MFIDPGWDDMALTMALFGAVVIVSMYEGLKLERDLIIGTVRTVLQLVFVGFVIKFLFAINTWWIVVGSLLLMLTYAAKAGLGRMKHPVPGLYMPMWFGVVAGSVFTIAIVTGVVLKADPWYRVDVVLPLGGMILGNAMHGGAIAADRLYAEIKSRKDQIETRLALGFEIKDAARDAKREAVRAALIPTINAMMTVGLVHLPGIMVGQMLSGVAPLTAAKYQIIIMLMIASAVTLTSAIFATLAVKSYFTERQQLKYWLLEE